MKIGILTYHRAHNYGAFLQAYGLCSKLNQENDIDAEIIDFNTDEQIKEYDEKRRSWKFKIRNYRHYKFLKIRRKTFENALSYYCLSKDYLHSDSIDDFTNFIKNKYDIIIVGSDEIWRLKENKKFPTPYWLPNNFNCMKVSYAVSSRNDLSLIPVEDRKTIKMLLKEFEILSIRDDITYNEFSKILPKNRKIRVDADPSFIFDYKASGKVGRLMLCNKLKLNINKKIALIMTDSNELAQMIKENFNSDYQLVSVFHWHSGYINVADLTPFEWIDVIAGVDFVFSSYFHGICFSIINKTPFLAVGTIYDKSSKLEDIIKKTNNDNRYVLLTDLKANKKLLKDKCLKLLNKPNGEKYIKNARVGFKEYIDILKDIYYNKYI